MSRPAETFSDAAKRASDAYMLHRTADQYGSIGKWLAIKLEDGSCNNDLYDSKSEAVKAMDPWESFYAYIMIGPWPFTPKEAEHFLALNRRLYEAGLRMADPDHAAGGRDVIKRVSEGDQYRQLRAMFKGDKPPTNLIIPGR